MTVSEIQFDLMTKSKHLQNQTQVKKKLEDSPNLSD